MREFQGKRRVKRWLYSKPVLAVLLLVVGLLANASWQMYHRYRFTVTELERARAEFGELKDRQADLSALVSAAETGEGLEMLVREKFAVAKPGEYVVTVIDKDKEQESATTTAQKSWWQWWRD